MRFWPSRNSEPEVSLDPLVAQEQENERLITSGTQELHDATSYASDLQSLLDEHNLEDEIATELLRQYHDLVDKSRDALFTCGGQRESIESYQGKLEVTIQGLIEEEQEYQNKIKALKETIEYREETGDEWYVHRYLHQLKEKDGYDYTRFVRTFRGVEGLERLRHKLAQNQGISTNIANFIPQQVEEQRQWRVIQEMIDSDYPAMLSEYHERAAEYYGQCVFIHQALEEQVDEVRSQLDASAEDEQNALIPRFGAEIFARLDRGL